MHTVFGSKLNDTVAGVNLTRRGLLGGCIATPLLLSAASAHAFELGDVFKKGNNVSFDETYNNCLGVPLAVYRTVSIESFDGSHIDVRIAAPAEVPSTRMPIIAVCTDDNPGPDYDLMTGSIAQRGYLILTLSYTTAKLASEPSVLSTRRAQYLRFMLDKLPDILNQYGVDKKMVDREKIGVAGYGEGAWTALELVGYNRSLGSSSAQADGRVTSSFALMPTPNPLINHTRQINDNQVFGKAIVAGDLSQLPPPPLGSGLMGLGLPVAGSTFGGLLGKRQITSNTPNQREILAVACAAANMFFDWTLKGQKTAYESLTALDGKKLPNIPRSLTFVQA